MLRLCIRGISFLWILLHLCLRKEEIKKKKSMLHSPSLWMDQYCYLTTETKLSTEEPLTVLARCGQPHVQATLLNSQQTSWSKVLYSISLHCPQEQQLLRGSDPKILITMYQRNFFGQQIFRWASGRWEKMKFFTLLADKPLLQPTSSININ